MAFPTDKTNAVDNTTDVLASHLNNLEDKVGINGSTDANSLDYKVSNASSSNPGHKHSGSSLELTTATTTNLTGVITGNGSVLASKTNPSGAFVGTTDTQTLTNKTINGDNNTISNLAHGSEVDNPSSGVHGVTGSVVGTTDTQTLTNKTLTSPKINEDVALTPTSTELNYVDGVTSAIQTQLDAKQADLSVTPKASGKVTDTTNGVTVSVGNSGLYIVFTEGWAGVAGGKVGMHLCSNISGNYKNVDTIISGTYSGTVTMPTNTSIKIVPYNADGCVYTIWELDEW